MHLKSNELARLGKRLKIISDHALVSDTEKAEVDSFLRLLESQEHDQTVDLAVISQRLVALETLASSRERGKQESRLQEPFASLSSPVDLLEKAIKATPAVRYAMGVVGLAAAAALVFAFFKSPADAVAGLALIVSFMVVLAIFTVLSKVALREFRVLAIVLAWVVLLLFLISLTLMMTSIFFMWPRTFEDLMNGLQFSVPDRSPVP